MATDHWSTTDCTDWHIGWNTYFVNSPCPPAAKSQALAPFPAPSRGPGPDRRRPWPADRMRPGWRIPGWRLTRWWWRRWSWRFSPNSPGACRPRMVQKITLALRFFSMNIHSFYLCLQFNISTCSFAYDLSVFRFFFVGGQVKATTLLHKIHLSMVKRVFRFKTSKFSRISKKCWVHNLWFFVSDNNLFT